MTDRYRQLEKIRKEEIMSKLESKDDQRMVKNVIENNIKSKKEELIKSMNEHKDYLKSLYAKWKETELKFVGKKAKKKPANNKITELFGKIEPDPESEKEEV